MSGGARISGADTPKAVQLAVLTVSDTRTAQTDRSGDTLVERATNAGHRVVARAIVADEIAPICEQVLAWVEEEAVDVVIVTGGTGLTGRDVTPEALEGLYEKSNPGFGELFRWLGYSQIGTSTLHSRATAGVRRGTYLFGIPGSPGACRDAWDGILAEQLDSRHRPCNLVDLMPRLRENE